MPTIAREPCLIVRCPEKTRLSIQRRFRLCRGVWAAWKSITELVARDGEGKAAITASKS